MKLFPTRWQSDSSENILQDFNNNNNNNNNNNYNNNNNNKDQHCDAYSFTPRINCFVLYPILLPFLMVNKDFQNSP